MKKYPADVDAFGETVRRLRKEKGFSIQKLADLCHIQQRTLIRIEAGEMALSLHILFALADALGMKPSEILKEAGR